MHKLFFEILKKHKNKVYFFVLILVIVGVIYHVFGTWKIKAFSEIYDISEEIISAVISGVDIGNRDLNRNQANRILDALNKNQYSYYGRDRSVIPGNLYHIILKTANKNHEITISDQNLLITPDIIYRISGNENLVDLIKKLI